MNATLRAHAACSTSQNDYQNDYYSQNRQNPQLDKNLKSDKHLFCGWSAGSRDGKIPLPGASAEVTFEACGGNVETGILISTEVAGEKKCLTHVPFYLAPPFSNLAGSLQWLPKGHYDGMKVLDPCRTAVPQQIFHREHDTDSKGTKGYRFTYTINQAGSKTKYYVGGTMDQLYGANFKNDMTLYDVH